MIIMHKIIAEIERFHWCIINQMYCKFQVENNVLNKNQD